MGFFPVALRPAPPSHSHHRHPSSGPCHFVQKGYLVLPSHHETTENITLGSQWGGPQSPADAISESFHSFPPWPLLKLPHPQGGASQLPSGCPSTGCEISRVGQEPACWEWNGMGQNMSGSVPCSTVVPASLRPPPLPHFPESSPRSSQPFMADEPSQPCLV